MPQCSRRLISALLGCFVGLSASAAVPAPEFIFPAGGKQGATVSVTVGGKLDGWPVGVWTSHAGLAFEAKTNSRE